MSIGPAMKEVVSISISLVDRKEEEKEEVEEGLFGGMKSSRTPLTWNCPSLQIPRRDPSHAQSAEAHL